jgi:hypothetical protein
MQYRTVCLVTLGLLAGCASQVPAGSVSNIDLCTYTLYGNAQDKVVSEQEAQRRGLDCAPLYPAIIARRQQQGQALQNAADYFNRPPAPAPRTTRCNSYQVGNTIQTDCR